MLWVCAGRCMFTLDAPKCDVTMITSDSGCDRVMGLQGLHATEAEAIGMIDAVIAAWKAKVLTFVPDKDVGI